MWVERARATAKAIAPEAARSEAERRLAPEVVRALTQAGVFKLMVPRAYGGAEVAVSTLVAVLEELARGDGAAGWCAMIGASSGLMAAFLPEAEARLVYGGDDAISCGVFAPLGRATPVDGGYRVSGRWPFASGCQHATWLMGGTLVAGATTPDVLSLLFPAGEVTLHDTWHTSGLRGTGSHDMEVRDLFVPAARSFSLITSRPRAEGALYRQPFFGVLAAGIAAVALGIGRAALDSLIELAGAKQPQGARRTLAHRETVQRDLARAEGRLRAGRALLFEAVERAAVESAAGAASLEARALLRLAACHATTEAAAAVDLAYEAGGGTSIYAHHPLQRCFRDVHTATQHVMVSSAAATLAGRVLLGLESDTATL
jgi:alkylation response protein AidB-like acyl-CoA dehydrogenase